MGSKLLQMSMQALHRLWVVEYQYQDFLIAPGMSIVGLLAGAALEYVFRRLTGRPYDLSNPFKQDDVMPVDVAPGRQAGRRGDGVVRGRRVREAGEAIGLSQHIGGKGAQLNAAIAFWAWIHQAPRICFRWPGLMQQGDQHCITIAGVSHNPRTGQHNSSATSSSQSAGVSLLWSKPCIRHTGSEQHAFPMPLPCRILNPSSSSDV